MGTNHDCIGIEVCHECQSQIKDDEPYVRFKSPSKPIAGHGVAQCSEGAHAADD